MGKKKNKINNMASFWDDFGVEEPKEQEEESDLSEEEEEESDFWIEGEMAEEEENSIVLKEGDLMLMSKILAEMPAEVEMVFEIFLRLPLKSLFKFKCVSKRLNNLTRDVIFTSKHARITSNSPVTGFFYQSKVERHQLYLNSKDSSVLAFVPTESELANSFQEDSPLEFLKKSKGDTIKLMDSCNGLLLCRNTTRDAYFLCNPLTKETALLTPPCLQSNFVHCALLASLTKNGEFQYKVVCAFQPAGRASWSRLLILSSKTGQWEGIKEKLPPLLDESIMGSKIFFNGTLFWDCLDGHFLVCHLNVEGSQSCYELIEAPRAPLGRSLWKSRDKLVCYCHGFPDEFPTWSMSINNKNELKWNAEGEEKFEMLTEDISRDYSNDCLFLKNAIPRFRVLAYNSECENMFLWIPNCIYSYDFKERKLEWVYGHRVSNFDVPCCVLPYVHSLALPNLGHESQIKKQAERSRNGSVVIGDAMGSMSLDEGRLNKPKSRRKKGTWRS